MSGQPLSEDREFEEDEGLLEPEQPDEAALAEAERESAATETVTAETEILNDVTQLYHLNEIGAKPLLTPAGGSGHGPRHARRRFQCAAEDDRAQPAARRGTSPSTTSTAASRCSIWSRKATSASSMRWKIRSRAWLPFLDLRHLVDRQSIERAIMNQSRTIRLPVHVVKELNIVLRAVRHLEKENGREISHEQIAHLIDKPVAEVQRILALNEHIRVLDAPLEIDPNHTIGDAIADENGIDPEARLESNELGDLLVTWVAQLPDKQRAVIERRYGLNGADTCTLK